MNNITRGGMIVALVTIILYFSTIFRFNKLAILGLSSIILALVLIKMGLKYTIIIYIAISILSLFLIPEKSIGLSFTVFFGLYPIIKALTERKRNYFIEYLLKYSFFNISLMIVYLCFIYGLFEISKININLIIIFLISEIFFFIYDKVFTLVLVIVLDKFGRYLNG